MTFLSDDVVGRLKDAAARPLLPAGHYRLGEVLGRGGMGTVYAARDERLDRDVAVKVSNAPAPDSALETRLKREALVLARLEHPGIVPVHDVGHLEDGRLFYVMKLVRGETLTGHAAELGSENSALPVFERIVETVAFAHAAGVIHRDLKPSNVMVGSFGEVLVLDWGVAKSFEGPEGPTGPTGPMSPTGPTGTADGTRIGTPGFMAPEQARGEAHRVGPASDVYGLGALFFWMLTGEAPSGPVDVAGRLRTAAAPVPRRLAAIVRKCLAPEPADRYADAAALAADLGRYRAGQAVSAHRETILDRAERWFNTYRTAILLVLAYLVMRTIFALAR